MIKTELHRFIAGTVPARESMAEAGDFTQARVLVVHREQSFFEATLAANPGKGGGVDLRLLHASSMEEGRELAEHTPGGISSLFIGANQSWSLAEDIRRFVSACESLQQVVVVVDREDATPVIDLSDLATSLPCLFTRGNPKHLLHAITAQLEMLRLQCQLLRTCAASRNLLSGAKDLAELALLLAPVTAQMADFFEVDVCLVADFAVPAKDHFVLHDDSAAARAQLREVMRRAESASDPNAAVEQIRLLVNLVGAEHALPMFAEEEASIRVTEFKPYPCGPRSASVAFGYALHDAMISAIAVCPRGPSIRRRMMLREFHALFARWAERHEALTVSSLRHHRENGDTRAKSSLQDSITEMVCGVSHEINTPLSVIRTASNIIAESVNGAAASQEDVAEAAHMIELNVVRLGNLVERFKSVAVSQLPEKSADVSILEPLNQAIARHAETGSRLTVNKIVDLDPGADIWLGFPRRLEQLIIILLDNAWEHAYRRGAGMVELALRGRRVHGNNRYSLNVADYGCGIPEANLPRVFDAFFTTARRIRATGLGLTVAKSLATEGLGGSIRCESTVGTGTAFFVNFASVSQPIQS